MLLCEKPHGDDISCWGLFVLSSFQGYLTSVLHTIVNTLHGLIVGLLLERTKNVATKLLLECNRIVA